MSSKNSRRKEQRICELPREMNKMKMHPTAKEMKHQKGREGGTKGELTSLLWCHFPIPPTTTILTKTDPTVDPRERSVLK